METQVAEATRYIAQKGWTLVDIYRDDENNTGRREFKKRKAFNQLPEDAAHKKFDVVVARDNTRLGGDTSRTMRAVEDLKDAGVAVWSYIDDREVRLGNWIEKATFAIQSAASEGERDNISSRTFEALNVRARAGFNAGGTCYGYTNKLIFEGNVKKRTEYEINEKEAEVVREIFRMHGEGCGLRTIVKTLNGRGVPAPRAGKRGTGSWAMSSVRPMLQRERYRGVIVYGRIQKAYKNGTGVRLERPDDQVTRAEAPHLRIVSNEQWDAAQERFRENARKPWRKATGRKPRYLLSARALRVVRRSHSRETNEGRKHISDGLPVRLFPRPRDV